jgi:hypothetical protein
MLDLVSTKLAFARDARQLLVIHDDHVAWHATSGDSRRLPIAGVDAIAAFGDQLWTLGPRGLERVVVRAAFLAAREQRNVSTTLLRRAAVLEMEDMGRVVHLQSRAA